MEVVCYGSTCLDSRACPGNRLAWTAVALSFKRISQTTYFLAVWSMLAENNPLTYAKLYTNGAAMARYELILSQNEAYRLYGPFGTIFDPKSTYMSLKCAQDIKIQKIKKTNIQKS